MRFASERSGVVGIVGFEENQDSDDAILSKCANGFVPYMYAKVSVGTVLQE